MVTVSDKDTPSCGCDPTPGSMQGACNQPNCNGVSVQLDEHTGSEAANNNPSWDALLTEEPQEGETYIQPNIELELSARKRKECRDILLEIKNFGVSQRQMLYLIYLLSLELDDLGTMQALVKAVGENRKNVALSITDGKGSEQVTKKLIID